MKLSFDKFERYELPQVTLCNPNSRATEVDGKITITDTVGVLSNPSGTNLKLNFNAPHELSFDYYRHKSTDPIKQSFYDTIYESIQTDRYVYLTDIGYFIISSVTDSDEDNIDKKSISLKSCEENELATAEGLYLEEGAYQLHTQDNNGLLDLFLPKTAGWTIGFIDPALLTKYDSETGEEKTVERYVEKTEVDNGYNFLYTTIQDMFECIVEPDIIKRTISVYSRMYYAEHHFTDIHIAKYNLLKHKTVEENDEDKYTALNVQGKDENLEIRAVNPTGKNVIYNFEPRYAWMSPALQDAVIRWQDKCKSVEDEYLTLQQGYYNDMQNIVFPLEEDIKVLELQLKEKEQTRDTIVYGDYDKEEYHEIQEEALKQVNAEIQNISKQISDKKAQLETEKNEIETNYSQPISKINSDCALDVTAVDIGGNTIFTVELLNELMTHIKPTDYVDEYMLVTESMSYSERFEKAKELMDRAQSQLVKISSGQKTYSIDTRSFLFNKQFKHFSEQLCPGAIIYAETKNDIMEQLHLTGIDINFDEKSAGLTLGNKYDRSDLKALYDEALGQNSKSFSELKYIAGILEEQRKQLDYQKNWVADLRTLTLDNVLTSEDQAIEINNRGLIGRKRKLDENGEWDFDENGNPFFEPEQVKLINNTLVFTKNNWESASTAVGKIAVGYDDEGNVKYAYGINGQVLIGELILGNNLVLTGTSAGIKIKNSSGEDAFYADDDGNLVLSGKIFANSGEIGGWEISKNVLQNTSGVQLNEDGTWKSGYRVGMASVTDENSAVFFAGVPNKSGSIVGNSKFYVTNGGYFHAESGDVGGWDVTSNAFQKTISADSTKYKAFIQSGNNITSGHAAFGVYEVNNDGSTKEQKFYVTYGGKLFAKNADIAGGTIAGFEIGSGGVYANALYKRTSNGNTSYEVGIKATSGYNDLAFYVKSSNNNFSTSANQFYVTNNGHLYANDAEIKGTINAMSGNFGVFKIGRLAISDGGDSIAEDGLSGEAGAVGYKRYLSFDPGFIRAIAQEGDDLYKSWTQILAAAVGSDVNLKYNVSKIDCEKLEAFYDKIRPCSFNYRPNVGYGNSKDVHYGVIAQEILEAEKVCDIKRSAIVMSEPNEPLSVRYNEFITLNIWQIQRVKKRIADLENTVAELKTQIQNLTAG